MGCPDTLPAHPDPPPSPARLACLLRCRYGAVVRGDQSNIYIGGYASIGDRTVIQSAAINPTGFSARTHIGDFVTIGQGCILRACTVDDKSVIGDGCIIQEGALVDRAAMLEPGSLLPTGARVPSGEVYGGSPAQFVRKLSKEEIAEFGETAESISALAAKHADEYLPYGTLYQLREEMVRQPPANPLPPPPCTHASLQVREGAWAHEKRVPPIRGERVRDGGGATTISRPDGSSLFAPTSPPPALSRPPAHPQASK